MSKKNRKKSQNEYEEVYEDQYNSNNMNNNQCYNFNNSPLGQISRMMGNIDMNTLAQMLANFNIKSNNSKNNNNKNISYKNKKQDNNIENHTCKEDGKGIDKIENLDNSHNNNEENIIMLLESIKNLCSEDTKEKVQEVIDIYSSKSYL